jgi:uncharacterized membrane protein YeaQ/YmgE (transglycosylase-associated protein family)
MRHNRSALFAWIAFFVVAALVIATFVIGIIGGSYGHSPLKLLRDGVWQLVPVMFALVGALIVSTRCNALDKCVAPCHPSHSRR